jgi:hypothetical protein
MRLTHLAEEHHYELSPTGESTRVALIFALSNSLLDPQTRKQLQQL